MNWFDEFARIDFVVNARSKLALEGGPKGAIGSCDRMCIAQNCPYEVTKTSKAPLQFIK
jgi:hypothetical protein